VPNTQALKVEKRRPHQDSKLSCGRPRHSRRGTRPWDPQAGAIVCPYTFISIILCSIM